MAKLYKLTTQDHYTRKGAANQCLWGENVTHSGTGEGDLCGPGWIHAYEHPLLAALLNPIHANIEAPVLWECYGVVKLRDGELKVGCQTLTTIRQVTLPALTTEFRICFAIKCALKVYKAPAFVKWAKRWLSGEDRSRKAANAAAAYAANAGAAAYAAAADAADAAYAAYAAYAAADAAYAAARATRAAKGKFILKVALEVAADLNVKWD
jgi:hypothetical protein